MAQKIFLKPKLEGENFFLDWQIEFQTASGGGRDFPFVDQAYNRQSKQFDEIFFKEPRQFNKEVGTASKEQVDSLIKDIEKKLIADIGSNVTGIRKLNSQLKKETLTELETETQALIVKILQAYSSNTGVFINPDNNLFYYEYKNPVVFTSNLSGEFLRVEVIFDFSFVAERFLNIVNSVSKQYESFVNEMLSWFATSEPFKGGINNSQNILKKIDDVIADPSKAPDYIFAFELYYFQRANRLETIKELLRKIFNFQNTFLLCANVNFTDPETGQQYSLVALPYNKDLFELASGIQFQNPQQEIADSQRYWQLKTNPSLKFLFTDDGCLQLLEDYKIADLKAAQIQFTEPSQTQNGTPEAARALREALKIKGDIGDNFNKYEQQCILLKLIENFTNSKFTYNGIDTPKREIPYDSFIALNVKTQIGKDALKEVTALTNKLNVPPNAKEFINIRNHVAAALIPKIRLFKSYTLKEGDTNRNIDLELPLEAFVNPLDVLDSNTSRNIGFGLKSFTWDNTSFNEYDRNISATLTMKFNSLDAVVQTRNGFLTDKQGLTQDQIKQLSIFRFLELIYQVPSKVNDDERRLSADPALSAKYQLNQKFKIKVGIGWEYDSNVLNNIKDGSATKIGIDSNNIMYSLYNKGHDINFEKDGSVVLTIYFQSAQEAYTNDEFESNILTDPGTKEELATVRQSYKEKQEELGKVDSGIIADDLKKSLEELQNKETQLIEKNSFVIYKKFINDLYFSGVIKTAVLNIQQVFALKKSISPIQSGLFPLGQVAIKDFTNLEDVTDAADVKQKIAKLKEEIQINMNRGDAYIPFFYFGDLINLVLFNLNKNYSGENLDREKIRFITGPLAIKSGKSLEHKETSDAAKKDELPSDMQNNVIILENIADIPISFTFFIDWFEEVVIKNRRTKYTFRHFLSDVVGKFLISALNPNCFGSQYKFQPAPKIDIFFLNASEGVGGKEKLTNKPLSSDFGGIRPALDSVVSVLNPIKNFENLKKTKIVTYLYMQCVYTDPLLVNHYIDEKEDSDMGIYHLRVGSDRGIVKNISFSKDDMPNIPVAIYQQHGAINPKVLRVPYNAEVEMIGNTLFKPGAKVYIDPTFALRTPSNQNFGSDPIRFLGLGGYYIVTRAVSSISSGKFDTKLTCRFTGYGSIKPPETTPKKGKK